MRTSELLVSSVSITEDDYHYRGTFILSGADKTMNAEISELEDTARLQEIKDFFALEDAPAEIGKTLMELVMEKAAISSKFNEGEEYDEDLKRKKTEKTARSFDLA